MPLTPLTRKLTRKPSSDDIMKAGDFYITDSLASASSSVKPHPAVILKCPYCRMDMATTSAHSFSLRRSWIRRLCGLPEGLTVKPMLQCPYVHAHRFNIRNSKVIPL